MSKTYDKYLTDALDYEIEQINIDYMSLYDELITIKKKKDPFKKQKLKFLQDTHLNCGCVVCPQHKKK